MSFNDEVSPGLTSSDSTTKTERRSEFDFIKSLREKVISENNLHSTSDGESIGDDAAVIRPDPGKEIVVSTDLLCEDVDFRRTSTAPFLLGHKSLAVSL